MIRLTWAEPLPMSQTLRLRPRSSASVASGHVQPRHCKGLRPAR
ncbi:hypothetical protein [Pseudorhodoferax sp.]|nr:hypothetical protein [Pseudorhodoferax sp.]